MARKRMIDPEFWSDEDIGKWSHSARLLYIGLWNFADDTGRFKAHPGLLKSQIFPYDEQIDIESLRNELGDKIQWYGVSGSRYGYIRNFLKHQRIDKPQPSKLPPQPKFDECSTNVPGTVPPNIKEVNIKEVNIKEQPSAALKAAFDEVFKAGLNIYALLGELKKQSKVGASIPEEVLLRVFEVWRRGKDQVKDQWPWFRRVVEAEWHAWNSGQNEKDSIERRKAARAPVAPAIGQILTGMGKRVSQEEAQ